MCRSLILFLIILQPLYVAAEPIESKRTWGWKHIALATGTTVVGITAVLVSFIMYHRMRRTASNQPSLQSTIPAHDSIQEQPTTLAPVQQPVLSPEEQKNLDRINLLLGKRGIPKTSNPKRLTLSSVNLSTTAAASMGDYELLEALLQAKVPIQPKALESAFKQYIEANQSDKLKYQQIIQLLLTHKALVPASITYMMLDDALKPLFTQHILDDVNTALGARGLEIINTIDELDSKNYLDTAFQYRDYELIQILCNAGAYTMNTYTLVDILEGYFSYMKKEYYLHEHETIKKTYLNLITSFLKHYSSEIPSKFVQQAQEDAELMNIFNQLSHM